MDQLPISKKRVFFNEAFKRHRSSPEDPKESSHTLGFKLSTHGTKDVDLSAEARVTKHMTKMGPSGGEMEA